MKLKYKKFLSLGLALNLLCFSSALSADTKNDEVKLKKDSVPVEVVKVKRSNIASNLKATGTVTAYLEATIAAQVGGEVQKVYVDEGQSVKKDAALLKTDDYTISLQRDRAEANAIGMKSGYEYTKRIAVLQVETRLKQAQASANAAKAQYEYAKNIAQLAFEAKHAQAKAARDTAAARLKQLKSGARPEERLQIKANLNSAQANYDNVLKNYERIKKLFAQGAVSSKQHDDVKTAHEAAESSLKNATSSWNLAVKGGRDEDVAAAEAALSQAEANLKLVTEELNTKSWEKEITLARSNHEQAAAQLELSENELKARAYEADIRRAEARDKDAMANLKIIQRQVDQTEVRAPFSGVAYGRLVEVGEMVAPGQPLIKVMQTDKVKITSSIGETNAAMLRLQQNVLISVDALPGKTFNGQIIELSPAIDQLSRTISLKVEVANPDALLKPGMFARLEIELEQREQALVIPKDTLIKDKDLEYVYTVEGDKAVMKKVTLGLSTKDSFEVTSGLTEGENVVFIGQSNLSDGKKVMIVNR